MKKFLIICILFIPAIFLYSQQSVFEYVEGEVTIKRISGDLIPAEIGNSIVPGDSVITGRDGYAELTLESNSTITIDKDTVFVFAQREKKEEKKSIFMIVLGKIGFKFDKLLQEPDIQTPSSVAGVRGTEFTVVTALDGSSLYVVSEGSVAVEAEGGLVVLELEEGVAVSLGEAPGEKFEARFGSEDYSGWLEGKNINFDMNPVETLTTMTETLKSYARGADDFYNQYLQSRSELESLRDELNTITDNKNDFYQKKVFPKEIETSYLVLNYRYYALSAYSLRRYVVGNMYLKTKTKYLTKQNEPVFSNFIKEYERFLGIFEKEIVPYLEERDV
ncbi:FecR family protein [Spirochaeta isovalerica]|uniref:FecR protein domain-containing protein n=1 Tax=Spirochaeta isovalerica TaxID=150 RepID=A0A841R4L2_9SPIO|nr:FecR domain-containing protein [Spirochaeta isovalerica]MBB6478733.1 hypothetical protein [Spirochaeta isovalerica]